MNLFAAHFAGEIDAGEGLGLRPLLHSDMPAIVAMFADPVIGRIWTSPPEKIADTIDEPHVWPFVVTQQGAPIGYLQAYHANTDDFWQRFGVPQETFGLDVFLTRRGDGIGPRVTRAMIGHIWRIPDAARIQVVEQLGDRGNPGLSRKSPQ